MINYIKTTNFFKYFKYSVVSFCCSFFFIFSNSDYIFFYFINRFQDLFFISDSNLLTSLFFKRVMFISWFLFSPVIILGVVYSFIGSFTYFEKIKVNNLILAYFYAHIFAYIINDYDLSFISPNNTSFSNFIGEVAWIERSDIYSYFNQYCGFFEDLFYFIFLYFCFWSIIFERFYFYPNFTYSLAKWQDWYQKNIIEVFFYKKVFYIFFNVWFFRFRLFFCFYYFFGGDCGAYEYILVFFRIIIIEINIRLLRMLIQLRSFFLMKKSFI